MAPEFFSPTRTDAKQPANTHAPAKTETQTLLGIITFGNRKMPEELPKWIYYPFEELPVGKEFTIPQRKRGDAHRMRAAARRWCARHGLPMVFRVLTVYERGKPYVSCWRLGTPLGETTTHEPQEPETLDGPVNL